MRIILASSSPFRRDLLARLGLPFTTRSPDLDETPHAGETGEALVRRLSEAKAMAIAQHAPDVVVIGSDQVAVLDGKVLGKPGGHAQAVTQLTACSGHEVMFYTGLCVIRDGLPHNYLDRTRVRFRDLDDEEIERYLRLEQPYQSAGSFKVEGLGISLFEAVHSDDPTALIGLPLIGLCQLLRQAGVAIP